MQKAEPFLEMQEGNKKVILAHEFLFLVVNCVDRMEYVYIYSIIIIKLFI